jgi:hypothetical protein
LEKPTLLDDTCGKKARKQKSSLDPKPEKKETPKPKNLKWLGQEACIALRTTQCLT